MSDDYKDIKDKKFGSIVLVITKLENNDIDHVFFGKFDDMILDKAMTKFRKCIIDGYEQSCFIPLISHFLQKKDVLITIPEEKIQEFLEKEITNEDIYELGMYTMTKGNATIFHKFIFAE